MAVLTCSAFALEISDFQGGFQGKAGSYPVNWRRYSDKVHDRSALTSEYSESPDKLMFYIEAPADRMTTFQSKPIRFPETGTVTFRFRARSLKDTAKVRLYLIADKYKHKRWKDYSLTEKWTDCAVELACKPDVSDPKFWARIDLSANGQIVVDAPEIAWGKAIKKADVGKQTSSAFALEISDFQGGFQGKAGSYPVNWMPYPNKVHGRNGLTSEYSESPEKLMMYMEAPTAFQSKPIRFPETGTVTFRFRARSLKDTAKVRLYLIADKYKHKRWKECFLTEKWTDCAVELACKPDVSDPKFWARIDLSANGPIVVDAPEIVWDNAVKKADAGNLVTNGSLSGGAWQFTCYLARGYFYPEAPVFTPGGSVLLTSNICFMSMLFPYQPKQTYTLLARMRNASPDSPCKINMFFINTAWKLCSKQVVLSPEWKTFALTGALPKSFSNQAYARFDVVAGKAEIDRIEMRAGSNKDFAPLPEREIHPAGNTLFDAGKDTEFQIRLIQNHTPKAGKLTLTVTDAFGKVIAKPVLNYKAVQTQVLSFPVAADHPRGVFRIRGEGADLRYAVLRDLSGRKLPQNRYAGHYEIYWYPERNLTPFQKYVPIGKNINRFFSQPMSVIQKKNKFQKLLDQSSLLNVIVFPTMPPEFTPSSACEATPENLKKLLDTDLELLRRWRGKVYGVEIFNEPELWRVRKGPDAGKRTMPPEKVVSILKYLHDPLKKTDPECRIIGPCSGDMDYIAQFIKAGGAKYVDAISYHGYSNDPDMEQFAEKVIRLKKVIQDAGYDLPVFNTEAYFGLRNSPIRTNDGELIRHYCKDSELEHANISAAYLLNHAVAGVCWCNFSPQYLFSGFLSEKNIFVLPAASALNAAIEFTGDAGNGKVVNLDDALRCFFFPDAKGGALATLRSLDGHGVVILPEEATAFDLFGNRIPGKKIKLSDMLIYLRFTPGCDSEKLLKSLAFSGIGRDFDARLGLTKNGVSAAVRNRRRISREVELSLSGVKANPAEMSLNLAPWEEKTLLFPVKDMELKGNRIFHLVLKMKGGEGTIFHTQDIRPFPVEYAEPFRTGTSGITLGKEDVSFAFNDLKWLGPEDLSAKVDAQWNSSGLFFHVRVTDDHFVPGPDLANSWKFDSLQFFFDMNSNATEQSEKAGKLRRDDLNYVIAQTADGKAGAFLSEANGTRYIGAANATTGLDDAVKVSVKRTGNVTDYQVFFPKETLYRVKFAPGSVIGFALLINDNDGKGRKAGLTTSSAGSEPRHKAHLFRKLILMDK